MHTIQIILLLLLSTSPQDEGKAIFLGKGNCYMCHGRNARGTVMAPNLTDAVWLNIDGSHAQIASLIKSGVPHPKRYPGVMPAMGGATLAPKEIEAVADYVVSLRAHRDAAAPRREDADSTSIDDSRGGGMGCGMMMMHGAASADSTRMKMMRCPRCMPRADSSAAQHKHGQ